jgi:hypothetical protein
MILEYVPWYSSAMVLEYHWYSYCNAIMVLEYHLVARTHVRTYVPVVPKVLEYGHTMWSASI